MVVALTSDAATREAAIKITTESLENEHSRGSVQAWEAMPDTTELAMSILTKTSRVAKKVFSQTDPGKKEPSQMTSIFQDATMESREGKLRSIESAMRAKLQETPTGGVSANAIYNNINQAIEYIEAWFRGYGVIPFRNRLAPTKPVIMQNMATTERARSELWTWLHHKVILSDLDKTFTEEFFLSTMQQVLKDIESSIKEGFLPKGKMSCDQFEKGCYKEAAAVLKNVVLSDHFEENLKNILLNTYHKIHGRM
jgi:malate synthase